MAVWGWDDISGNASMASGGAHDTESSPAHLGEPRPYLWVAGVLLGALFLALITYLSHFSSAPPPP